MFADDTTRHACHKQTEALAALQSAGEFQLWTKLNHICTHSLIVNTGRGCAVTCCDIRDNVLCVSDQDGAAGGGRVPGLRLPLRQDLASVRHLHQHQGAKAGTWRVVKMRPLDL